MGRQPWIGPVALLAVLLGVGLGVLSGCDGADKRVERSDQDEAAIAQLADPVRGPPELRRLILENVTVRGEFVAVRIYSDVEVIPLTTPWTVRCGTINGVTVVFNADVSDEGGGLSVRIAEVKPTPEQCVAISLAAATALRSVLAGQ